MSKHEETIKQRNYPDNIIAASCQYMFTDKKGKLRSEKLAKRVISCGDREKSGRAFYCFSTF
jgi:hypothetical protein